MKTLLALILITSTVIHAQLAPSSGSLSTRKATPTKKSATQPRVVYVPVTPPAASASRVTTSTAPAEPIVEVRRLHGTQTLQDIQDAAAAKWPGNFDMQQYEIEKQARAFAVLSSSDERVTPATPPAPQYAPPPAAVSTTYQSADSLTQKIAVEAVAKWPGNFDMQVHEITRQNEARVKLGQLMRDKVPGMSDADFNAIAASAARKWDWNIDMVVYDMRQQIAAWRKLNP
jgi:hypothetical protein